MDSKKLIDKITIEYLSSSRLKKTDFFCNNKHNIIEDIKFYKKRILNTTREILKKITDISNNESSENMINNNNIEEALLNYLNVLIYAYKQDDIKDIINKQNGFTEEYFLTKKELSSCPIDISNIDIYKINNNIFKKSNNLKNQYDWKQYCKIEKKVINVGIESIPKVNDINLKDPSLRTKGIKNKKI